MKNLKKIKKNNVYSFSYLKKTKNDINDFYYEWERFQKIIKTNS
jgi:hypothetical protein